MGIFLLGPSVDSVIENAPPTPPPPGRQRIDWGAFPPNAPGGRLTLKVLPKVADTDIEPTNVYAFYVPQNLKPADQTPDAYFALTGVANASVHAATADPTTGLINMIVPGVTPSLTPYFVQTVVEYPA